jgi:hypothetical protein
MYIPSPPMITTAAAMIPMSTELESRDPPPPPRGAVGGVFGIGG